MLAGLKAKRVKENGRRLIRPVFRPAYRLAKRALGGLFYRRVPEDMTLPCLAWFIFMQKLLGFNRDVPFPVYPSSYFVRCKNIEMAMATRFNIGCYIQAVNGIKFGRNVWIGPNVCILSANHDPDDYSKHIECPPIVIGDNVWIGANAVILPGVNVGNNVVIGAGSIVTRDVPDNSIAVGNPCCVMAKKPPYMQRLPTRGGP